jgi:hypothetical protein
MLQSAKDAQLSEYGYCGGLIHDEIRIQEDLVMVRGGSDTGLEIVGYAELPEECMDIHALWAGERKQELATDILQIIFQGINY